MRVQLYIAPGVPGRSVDIPEAVVDCAQIVAKWMMDNNVTDLLDLSLRFQPEHETK